jgi:hypothetical protein
MSRGNSSKHLIFACCCSDRRSVIGNQYKFKYAARSTQHKIKS